MLQIRGYFGHIHLSATDHFRHERKLGIGLGTQGLKGNNFHITLL